MLAEETRHYADSLKTDNIIYHPGVDGEIEETVSQLKEIGDDRILIENKPYYSLGEKLVCIGHSPADIDYLTRVLNLNFCLDIGHAVFSSNAKSIDPLEYLREFIALKPVMFHLTDGNYLNDTDEHEHLGQGSFKLKEIFSMMPNKFMLTLETKKDFCDKLDDFIEDVEYLNRLVF